jgi:predicted alpha/beta-fold hydrolase
MAGDALTEAQFRPRAPWWGGDLQTMRNNLVGRGSDLSRFATERILFPMPDAAGDKLVGTLNLPEDGGGGRPLVVLIHGIAGSEASLYIRRSARHFLDLGYRVLRLNLRGAGPSRPLCQGQYHAGRSEDLRAVISGMDGRLAASGLFIVGVSLGGNMLLKYLAEAGRLAPVLGAATVSAPIDLKAAQARMMASRNWLYHAHMLDAMKKEILASASALSEEERGQAAAVRSVFEFDDRLTAPRGGFTGADDYYRRCSAEQYLMEVKVPTLIIHAQNDPWIPFAACARIRWRDNPKLEPLFPEGGGHVGFHEAGGRGTWHDAQIAAFLARLRR